MEKSLTVGDFKTNENNFFAHQPASDKAKTVKGVDTIFFDRMDNCHYRVSLWSGTRRVHFIVCAVEDWMNE